MARTPPDRAHRLARAVPLLLLVGVLAVVAVVFLHPGTMPASEPRAPAAPIPDAAAAPLAAATRTEAPADAATDPAATAEGERRGASSVSQHPEWRPVRLAVLDRATREDLKDVEVAVELTGAHGHRPIDDSFERQNALRGDSPLTIPPKLAGLAASGFLVRAAGHAAALVDLDFEAGGAREVLLDPACELRLRIDAPAGDEKLIVQLRRVEDALAWFDWRARYLLGCARTCGLEALESARTLQRNATVLSSNREHIDSQSMLLARSIVEAPASWSREAPRQEWIKFEHLPAGEWIAIVVAEPAREVLRGAAGAKLEAGGAAELTIEVSARAPIGKRRVRGTVELASGWSDDAAAAIPARLELQRVVHLAGQPREDSERTIMGLEREGDSLRFAWDAGELAGGVWTATLPQYGFVAQFFVEAPGTTAQEVALTIGPPCDVVLTPIDAVSRAPVVAGLLQFTSGMLRSGFTAGSAEPRDGVYRFHVPTGRLFVQLEVTDALLGYSIPQFATFDLAPGVNALSLEIHRRAWLRILMKDGDAVVPCLCDECHVEARRIDGAGGLAGWSFNGGRDVRWLFSDPGRYSVRVVGQAGFLDSDPIEVELAPEALVDVTIPMKRAR